MKHKEEAERLIELFRPHAFDRTRDGAKPYSEHVELSNAKACAAICVKEIMGLDVWGWPHNAQKGILYWQKVLEEINQ